MTEVIALVDARATMEGTSVSKTLFISYSSHDRDVCHQLIKGFEDQGLQVDHDGNAILGGSHLRRRIGELIDRADHTICLISRNSLRSLWVTWEIMQHLGPQDADHTRFIPAYLDRDFLKDDFVGRILAELDERIASISEHIKSRVEQEKRLDDLTDRHSQILDARNHLSHIVRELRERAVVSLEPEVFEEGFLQLYKQISGNKELVTRVVSSSSVGNTDYDERRRAIENLLAEPDLSAAAKLTMDVVREFHPERRDLLGRAVQRSSEIDKLLKAYEVAVRRPSGPSPEFMNDYRHRILEEASALLELLPQEASRPRVSPAASRLSAASNLKQSIRLEKLGFRDRFLRFVREYGSGLPIEQEAALASLRLATAEADAREAMKSELIAIVDRAAGESQLPPDEATEAERDPDYERARRYIERKEVTFRCRGIKRSFGEDFQLGPISLELRKGDITGVVGENGNGKTTLFKLIAGELSSDGGELEYPFVGAFSRTGIDWSSVKSRIAYVPQDLPKWRGHLHQLLQYEAAVHGIRGDDNVLQIDYVTERLGLRAYLNKRWGDLSEGFKFRFALARALVWKPDMMLLDEPLADLDINAQQQLLRDLRAMARNISDPIAVVVSSQHLEEVEAVADHIVFLERGEATFNGPREKLGQDRRYNVFELSCREGLDQLARALEPLDGLQLAEEGMSYLVSVDRRLTAESVLRSLLDAGIELVHFRDISRSSKRIFRQIARSRTSAGAGRD